MKSSGILVLVELETFLNNCLEADLHARNRSDPFGFGFNFGRNNRGEDTVIDLSLTLEDVISGKNETIEVPSLEKCSVCNGSGCYPGTKRRKCTFV